MNNIQESGAISLFRRVDCTLPDSHLFPLAMLDAVRSGHLAGTDYRGVVQQIREAKERGDDARAKSLKRPLPAVTWGGTFARRSNEGLQQHSGLLCIDLDNLSATDLADCREALAADPHTFALFTSPSGNGLKWVLPIPRAANDSEHKEAFAAVAAYLADCYGITPDESGKDVARLCFLSHDPEAVHNPNAQTFALEYAPPTADRSHPNQHHHNGHRPPAVHQFFSPTAEPTTADVTALLRWIPTRPEYALWIRIIAAVGDALPTADAIAVLKNWSAEERPGEYADRLNHRMTKVRYSTLVYIAKQYGYTPPKRTPEGAGEHNKRSLPLKQRSSTGPGVAMASVTHPAEEDDQEAGRVLSPVQPFNASEMLPEVLRDWCVDIAERREVPPDFPATFAVLALGGLVGRRVGIHPKQRDNWLELPNLWGGVVAKSGEQKSGIFNEIFAPLRQLEQDAKQENEARELEYQGALLAGKARRAELEGAMKSAAKRDDSSEMERLAREIASCELPPLIQKRFTVSDTTTEKLGLLLADNPHGLLFYRDELAGWIRSFAKKGREEDRTFYMECWEGRGSRAVDRMGRKVEFNQCLSIIGNIQPGPLARYVREAAAGEEGADGLFQRFQLMVWPDITGEVQGVDQSPNHRAKEGASALFRWIAELDPERELGAVADWVTDERGKPIAGTGIPALRFAPDAAEVFRQWYITHRNALRRMTNDAITSHLAKYPKLVPALALLFHICDVFTGKAARGAVDLRSLQRALIWADYLESHARRIYSLADTENLKQQGGRGWPSGKARFLHSLPNDTFTTAEVLRLGEERTVKRWLTELCATDLLERVGRGQYRKTRSALLLPPAMADAAPLPASPNSSPMATPSPENAIAPSCKVPKCQSLAQAVGTFNKGDESAFFEEKQDYPPPAIVPSCQSAIVPLGKNMCVGDREEVTV